MFLDLDYIKENDAINTYSEIFQQASIWELVYEDYKERKSEIEEFLAKAKGARVIFTGAGTSEYVGNIAKEYLKAHGDFEFESVATTDLVSCPYLHFKKDCKTLLVSFARSGNSPESLAAVELGESLVDDFYNLAITCAEDGKLAEKLYEDEKSYVFIEPAGTNDKGFAMTSSFTSMLLTSLLIFDKSSIDKEEAVKTLAKAGRDILDDKENIENLVNFDFNRIIYLGSGPLYKLTNEARLKVLELTAGKVASMYESSMGFRHGPKSFVDDKTLIVSFLSSNPYTRQYDKDILDELCLDGIAEKVIGVSSKEVEGDFDKLVYKVDGLGDAYLCVLFAMIAQLISLITSLRVGNTPDNPSKSHTVNRVVKGVTIHEYDK